MEEAVKDDYRYKRGHLLLTAYSPKVGTMKEDILIVIYNRLKEQGLWGTVFHESPGMSMLEFMNFFSYGNCLLQILCVTDSAGTIVDIAGIAWLADLVVCQNILTRAVGSFVFFKEYQKPIYTDQFSEIILDFWFTEMKVDVIVGVTPEPNRAALLFVKRAGFKEVGRLPGYTTLDGKIVTGVVTSMSKQEHKELSGG